MGRLNEGDSREVVGIQWDEDAAVRYEQKPTRGVVQRVLPHPNRLPSGTLTHDEKLAKALDRRSGGDADIAVMFCDLQSLRGGVGPSKSRAVYLSQDTRGAMLEATDEIANCCTEQEKLSEDVQRALDAAKWSKEGEDPKDSDSDMDEPSNEDEANPTDLQRLRDRVGVEGQAIFKNGDIVSVEMRYMVTKVDIDELQEN